MNCENNLNVNVQCKIGIAGLVTLVGSLVDSWLAGAFSTPNASPAPHLPGFPHTLAPFLYPAPNPVQVIPSLPAPTFFQPAASPPNPAPFQGYFPPIAPPPFQGYPSLIAPITNPAPPF